MSGVNFMLRVVSPFWRRLTDLPTGWLPDLLGDSRTTDGALRRGVTIDELGHALVGEAQRRRRRLVVLALSEAQARKLMYESSGPETTQLKRLVAEASQHRAMFVCTCGPASATCLTLWWARDLRRLRGASMERAR